MRKQKRSHNKFFRQTTLFRLLILFLLLTTAALLSSQQSGRIQGRVLEEGNLRPIEGALISIKSLQRQAHSNAGGDYELLNLPPGIYEVECSFPHFETQIKSDINIQSGQTVSLDFILKESLVRVEEKVTVEGRALRDLPKNATSTFTIESAEATKLPGTYRDVSRILSAVPSAAHMTDKSNDLIVRGGSPWENGFFIDNIPIPNINHFQRQGRSGGAIGLINIGLIDDIQFAAGGFSAKYGNRMSSIVDIHFREGRKDKFSSYLDLNLAGFGGTLEGPILGDKGTWIFSLNRSYYGFIGKIVGYDFAPSFGDVHFKFTYDINPHNKLTFLHINGDSHLEYDLEDAVEKGLNAYLSYGTKQYTTGLNWFSSWGNSGYSNTSLSYSSFRIKHSITEVNEGSAIRNHSLVNEYNGDLNFRSNSFFKLGNSAEVQFGIDVNNHLIDFDNFISAQISRWEEDLPEIKSKGRVHATQSGAFLSLSFHPNSRITTVSGLRLDHYSYNHHWLLSPRFSFAWDVAKKVTLSAAFGFFHQNVPLSVLSTNLENEKNRDPYAVHYILGISYRILEDVNFSLDIYDKEYRALPLASEDPTQFIMDSGVDLAFYRSYNALIDTGKAYARGIEVLLQKKLMKGIYGLISGTVFRSRFRDVTGIWRNRINDNVYAMKIIGGYLPENGWGVSIRFNLSGGLPYTPYDLERSYELNRSVYIREKALAERYPPYMTLDFRVDKTIQWEKSSLALYLGATNLLNRKNVDGNYWNRVENKPDIGYQAPFLPVFGFHFTF